MKVQKDLCHTLAGMKINRIVRVTVTKACSYARILKLCPVQIYGLKHMAPLDTEATPYLISTSLLKKIGVRDKHTKRGIMVVIEDHVNTKGVFKNVPVLFDNVIITMRFLAVD